MHAFIRALPAVLRAAGTSDEVTYAAVVIAWKAAAGEALCELAIPLRLFQDRLTVAVGDAVWQKQLEAMRGQFLFRVNSILGQQLVTSIEFRIQPDIVAAAREARSKRDNNWASSVNNSVIPLELLSAAAAIRDAKLRTAFLAAATSSLERQENDRKEKHANYRG